MKPEIMEVDGVKKAVYPDGTVYIFLTNALSHLVTNAKRMYESVVDAQTKSYASQYEYRCKLFASIGFSDSAPEKKTLVGKPTVEPKAERTSTRSIVPTGTSGQSVPERAQRAKWKTEIGALEGPRRKAAPKFPFDKSDEEHFASFFMAKCGAVLMKSPLGYAVDKEYLDSVKSAFS